MRVDWLNLLRRMSCEEWNGNNVIAADEVKIGQLPF